MYPMLGDALGVYLIESELSSGGMGTVYLVLLLALGILLLALPWQTGT